MVKALRNSQRWPQAEIGDERIIVDSDVEEIMI